MKIAEILNNLKEPIPSELISHKRKGNTDISYVAWYDLTDLLDTRCGLTGWEWKLIDQQQIGNRHTQVWELTIIGEDGKISRQASGDEDVDLDAWGTPATNVEAQCLRRACAKFGLGRELWRKKSPQLPAINQQSKPMAKGEISRDEWLQRKQSKVSVPF